MHRRSPIIADLVIGAAEEAEGQSRRGEETGDEARREEIALDAVCATLFTLALLG